MWWWMLLMSAHEAGQLFRQSVADEDAPSRISGHDWNVPFGAISNSVYREFRAAVNAQPESRSRAISDRRHVVFPLDASAGRTAAALAPSTGRWDDAL
jgi:hypothetical protein